MINALTKAKNERNNLIFVNLLKRIQYYRIIFEGKKGRNFKLKAKAPDLAQLLIRMLQSVRLQTFQV